MREEKRKYYDMISSRRKKNQLIPEEFPEGAYGSAINEAVPVEGKSTPWEEGQYRESAYVFPHKSQHDDLPRQADGAHPIHDEKNKT